MRDDDAGDDIAWMTGGDNRKVYIFLTMKYYVFWCFVIKNSFLSSTINI